MYVFVKDNEEAVIVTNLSSHLLVHSFDLLSLGVAPLHQNLYDGGLVHIYVMSSTVYQSDGEVNVAKTSQEFDMGKNSDQGQDHH